MPLSTKRNSALARLCGPRHLPAAARAAYEMGAGTRTTPQKAGDMSDIFISYASEDRDRVRPLADALQQRGFNVWWDRSLAAGDDYTAIIDRELRTARAVIVVWTQGSVASTFVRDEAGRARDEGRLVPVLL